MSDKDLDHNLEEAQEFNEEQKLNSLEKTIHLSGMYQNWFLDYASYVILERAVPDIHDGLKPVQRRILHAMKEMDDGRFNKVANIIGNTMKYHPHGDASIGDALVQLGQKEFLIDTQGNWGNVFTGDGAAAPRYIEARLSGFAKEIVFNPKTTQWKASYDGRNKEPVKLPVKFPLLLLQGVEGIAVGLASKILPHNFNELIEASIRVLKHKDFEIFPDFPTGGLIDINNYKEGLSGGKIKVRAKIHQEDKKTLIISELPFGTNTTSLIESIISASDKGKIKIKKVDDNTAEKVEIIVHLPGGVSPDKTIDALYAFTRCEQSVSPNACVIVDSKPMFIDVKEILRFSTQHTMDLLRQELEIRKSELQEQWHFSSLEKIFIEKRIYHKIEECETWEAVIETIDKGLKPYKKLFKRTITRDDIIRLTEIKIKRISKYNAFKADELIRNLELSIEEVDNHLDHMVDYAINYFKQIRKKYGKNFERKTEIRNFETIEAKKVAAATERLYLNREEGFAGTSLRKNEFVCECSDIDDIIAFRKDGTFIITPVVSKTFVGKDIIHIDVFKKNDDRTIYNMIYRDGFRGVARVKRFAVTSVMRDKEYDLTNGKKGSHVLYFTANPNGEAEVIRVYLNPKPKLRKLSFEFDFSELAIKSRSAQGNILTKYAINKIVKSEEGISTLSARDIWYDDTVRRLNEDERGKYLGAFKGDDLILTIQNRGFIKLMNFDLANHFEEDMIHIEKLHAEKPFTTIYFDTSLEKYYIKRFLINGESAINKELDFIGMNDDNNLVAVTQDWLPRLRIIFDNKANKKVMEDEIIIVAEFIAIKGIGAKGKRLTNKAVTRIEFIDPLPFEPEKDADVNSVSESPLPEEGEADSQELSKANMATINTDSVQVSEIAEEKGEKKGNEKASIEDTKKKKKSGGSKSKIKKSVDLKHKQPLRKDLKEDDSNDDDSSEQMALEF